MIPGPIQVAVAGATAGAPLPGEDGVHGALVLAALGALVVAVYAVACVVWPYRPCWWCKGSGKRRSPSGKAWGKCRHGCQGGSKLRVGRRLVEWWRR